MMRWYRVQYKGVWVVSFLATDMWVAHDKARDIYGLGVATSALELDF
jgi:hypothetical protein